MEKFKFIRAIIVFVGILVLIACGNVLSPMPAHAQERSEAAGGYDSGDIYSEMLRQRMLQQARERAGYGEMDFGAALERSRKKKNSELFWRIFPIGMMLLALAIRGLGSNKENSESETEDDVPQDDVPQEQYDIGFMYETGLSAHEDGRKVPQSYEMAAEWYRKAADGGHAQAQYQLGLMYEEGRGVPRSNEEAADWYRKAAEQGFDRKTAEEGLEKVRNALNRRDENS